MENPRPEKESKIKDVRNPFRLEKDKKKTIDTTIKDIKNLVRIVKENKAIKDRILKDIKNIFENGEEKNYFKPVRTSNFWSNNYIEYECNSDRNKKLLVEEYFNKIRPYLKDIINKLKKSDTWKIQLTIAINFISSINNNEERLVHSKSVEITINEEADEVIK